jgi:hypothetical protein
MQTHMFSRFIHHICFIFFLIIVSTHNELSMRGAIRPAPRFCSFLLSPELDTDTKILLLLCFFLLLRSLPTLQPSPEPTKTKAQAELQERNSGHSTLFGSQANDTAEQEATVTHYWVPTEDEGEATRRRCRPSDAMAIAAAASKASGRQQGWKRTNVGGKAAKTVRCVGGNRTDRVGTGRTAGP